MLNRMPAVLAILLTACGGGGGDSGENGTSLQASPGEFDGTVSPETTASHAQQTTHAVGVRVSGLAGSMAAAETGLTVVLDWPMAAGSSAGQEVAQLTADGTFRFDRALPETSRYTITVAGFPSDRLCSVEDGGAEQEQTVLATGDNTTRIDCESWNGRVAGTVHAPYFFMRDSDVNDPDADYADNSSLANAQSFSTAGETFHIQGFVTAEATGDMAAGDRFAMESDPADFYRVSLRAGSRLSLQIAAHEAGADLDLYLYSDDSDDSDDSHEQGEPELSMVSMQADSTEEITVPGDGDYFIEVRAAAGTSAYALRVSDTLAGEQPSGWSADFVPGEVILATSEDSTPDSVAYAAGLSSAGSTRSILPDHSALLQVNTTARQMQGVSESTRTRLATLDAIKRLQNQSSVTLVEPNFRAYPQRVPDDEYFTEQWHHEQINLPAAWDITTGEKSGGNVVVAVIDSGVMMTHPELRERLLPGYDFISDPARSLDGDGIDANPDDPGDPDNPGTANWHGTHVAGLIAAQTDNRQGVAGISWHADIMPLRAFNSKDGTVYDILQAVLYAAGLENDSGRLPERPADIINLSVGGENYSAAAERIFQRVAEQGVIVVASAGNAGVRTLQFPAGYDSVLAVAASDRTDTLAPYSSFGAFIDIVAPGTSILSTSVNDRDDTRIPVVRQMSGTSMAAPQVAGTLALMKALYPALDAATVRRLLVDGGMTRDLDETGFDIRSGFGRLDALKAVQSAQQLAAGASLPDEPLSYLVPAYELVDLEDGDYERFCVYDKLGTGAQISSLTSGQAWLRVRESRQAGPGAYCLDLSVDRSDLHQKTHFAGVTISHTAPVPDITFTVTIDVERSAPQGTLGPVSVLLTETGSAGRVPVGFQAPEMHYPDSGEARFELRQLRHGAYHVVAGSDVDNDGVTCHVGEICGVYRRDDDGTYVNPPLDEADIATRDLVPLADGQASDPGRLEINTVLVSSPLDHPSLPAAGLSLTEPTP